MLRGIEVFLSFVRGQSCGMAIAQGKDKEDRVVWSRWGSPHVAPGNRRHRWLRPHKSDDELAAAFSEFWRRYSEPGRGEMLANILDWYMSTQESAVHLGLILSQAVLESLSCYVLRRRKRNREPAGRFIHDALVSRGTDSHVTVPGRLRNLSTYMQRRQFVRGSEALAKLRDDLVRASPGRTPARGNAVLEANWWAQWCIELSLLKLFKYDHEYWNRLTKNYEVVP